VHKETVCSLVEVKRCLASAWRILDGTEHALNSALASIDAIYAIEHVNAYNADVTSPVDLVHFWA
jgi:hypothetical protein